MLHAEAHEGGQRAVVLGDGAFDLDLAEGDEEALLELGVEAEQPRGLAEVAAGRGERVHGCGGGAALVSFPPSPRSNNLRNRKEIGSRGERDRPRGRSDPGAGWGVVARLSRPETARQG